VALDQEANQALKDSQDHRDNQEHRGNKEPEERLACLVPKEQLGKLDRQDL
jgi:hypothetical protein